MRLATSTAAAAVAWLIAGVSAAGDGASERAIEFVAADPSSTELLGPTETAVLLIATALAVLASVILLAIGGARARSSGELLDRLDTTVGDRDD